MASMAISSHARFYSPEEITAIADRLCVRVEAERTISRSV